MCQGVWPGDPPLACMGANVSWPDAPAMDTLAVLRPCPCAWGVLPGEAAVARRGAKLSCPGCSSAVSNSKEHARARANSSLRLTTAAFAQRPALAP